MQRRRLNAKSAIYNPLVKTKFSKVNARVSLVVLTTLLH